MSAHVFSYYLVVGELFSIASNETGFVNQDVHQ
jgi:hypothetical protein